ncbi:MAG TPA: exosortase system-associated protein, TIGR04073 family, partial [Chthoniobacterales bacterium]|nr:exosortase system-associated protein, TIGR04073 family [Chthoniobacterales bacterium]
MRTFLAAVLLTALASLARADIHDPPSNNQGPTRKLGRGISNLLFGWSELPHEVSRVNEKEGNSAAGGFGVVRGVGRSVLRVGAGIFEILTFPVPVARGTYFPLLPDETHWKHAGYKEFPPELGNESKYPYTRK